jgi:xanthine dehydrogenase accessory factor
LSEVVSVAEAARAALEVQKTGRRVSVVLLIRDDEPAARMLVFEDGTTLGSLGPKLLDDIARDAAADSRGSNAAISRVVDTGSQRLTIYIETHSPVERLIVVGAGHIAVPLAELGALLDFDVTVLDDRPEFAEEERFGEGVRVMRADFGVDPFANVIIDDRTYIALVTRGHMWDFDCLARILRLDVRPRYIGMIGSKRRVRAAYEALDAAGIDRVELGHIHAPIGLDIDAETPAEIAVSIAAELVAVRRRGANVASARNTASRRDVDRIADQVAAQNS